MRTFETLGCRVLVVAAHPDDETIGCGALLGRVSDAYLAYVTDGVPKDASLRPVAFRDDAAAYGSARQAELRRAIALVGMDEARVIELGGVDQESSYTMLSLVERLLQVIEEVGPNLVITHPYEGGHPDHDTTAFVTRAACTIRQRHHTWSPAVWEMTSYHAQAGQLASGRFLDDACATEAFILTLSPDERRCKELMMRCFATQEAVLASFGVDAERFRRAPAYDFSRPPHPGLLYYERLGWPLSGRRWRELAREATRRLLGRS